MQSNNFNRRLMVSNLRAITIVADTKAVGFGPAFPQRVEVKLL